MNTVEFAGHRLSAMMLGTAQLGLDYGIANRSGKPSPAKAFELLDAAAEGGVNAIDTAAAYGDAEDVLGSYLASAGCKQRDPFLLTKFRLDPARGMDRREIEKQLYACMEQSLERLRVSRIPLYMLHHAPDMSLYGSVVPDTLGRMQREGLIAHAGVSVYYGHEAEEMLRYDVYEAIQVPMNVFDLRLVRSGVLRKLGEACKLILVRSVFLQGFFFLDPASQPERYAPATMHLQPLRDLAEREGMSVAQLALSYIRDMEGVASLVLGAETPEQVRENIGLLEGPSLSPATAAKLEELSARVPIEFIMSTVLTGK
ncbi:MAG: aldo/keto reductase [Paenibacillaceae bacterium]|nr:aldo/keto reductase [Paenibacillaceae bacterium]